MGPCDQNRNKSPCSRVPYHGQKPHTQSKCPGAMFCFKFGFKNAKKAAAGKCQRHECKERTRIEHLMNGLSADLNKLLIRQMQTRPNSECDDLVRHLRTIKIKADEVKFMASKNSCIRQIEEMLKTRARLQCHLDSLRRRVVEFSTNVEFTERRMKAINGVLSELKAMGEDLKCLCYDVPVKFESGASSSEEEICENQACGDVERCGSEGRIKISAETSISAGSIHLRYVPQLKAVKANMASNPCAVRLPLMCPSMKRIMNKMKPYYLLDDVPVLKNLD
ncbi:unnamed protein product [Nesidiocoris tenuis]|uniref:Uncharacterized protein n=2 Tax=Nesidiocoris tenuis TaxID=355587 RepID=A0ABN7AY03_9HEMI|nr:Hypothetical protein NTJ_09701 [Nesidiocoris tenuis]CAB0008580.1 unnamed protein product [Nesidiocoris tenuis]